MDEAKICPGCGNAYTRPRGISRKQWDDRVYCSNSCKGKAPEVRKNRRPWEGDVLCKDSTAGGDACSDFEVEGLEYCLHHMPDELLAEAEELTGQKRCRRCSSYAVKGTEPPACKNHGANAGSLTSANAARRVLEDQAIARLEQIMSEDADAARILNPEPIGNPLLALLELAAEIRALRQVLRDRALAINQEQWRYRGRDAEMVRAEITLYERAQEREAAILIQIAKLRIDDRLAAVSERRIQAMERALTLALQASGVDLPGQDRARTVLQRELAKVSMN